MSAEAEVAELLRADTGLMAILTGGVWTDEEIGVEGIRRGEGSLTNEAFDAATGYLLPCAVVRGRGIVPVQITRSQKNKISGTRQVVEIYFYQFRGHETVDQAKEDAYFLLEGERITDSYPLIWDGDTPHLPDVGPIANSTTVRQDWIVTKMRKQES